MILKTHKRAVLNKVYLVSNILREELRKSMINKERAKVN